MWRRRVERAEKSAFVASLQSSLSTAGSIVVARNAGLTVAEMETLRRQMKQAGGQVKVAKNRLAKLALKDSGTADISSLFTGPVVIAYAQDPQSQVELFKLFGNGPANPAAASLIPADRRHLNCTDPDNLPRQIMLSHEWYTDHYAVALEQYLTHVSK